MENEIMEGGLWLTRWNFEKHGYSMKNIRFISPKVTHAFSAASGRSRAGRSEDEAKCLLTSTAALSMKQVRKSGF